MRELKDNELRTVNGGWALALWDEITEEAAEQYYEEKYDVELEEPFGDAWD
jgi:hypothetical protein